MRKAERAQSGRLPAGPANDPIAAVRAHRLTQQWAMAGISLQGLTISVVSDKFVGFAAFDDVADANRAAAILADLGAGI